MKIKTVLATGLFLCLYSAVLADEPVTNEILLKEIRQLKEIVTRQAGRIVDLEQRVKEKDPGARVPGFPAADADIDQKIDERLEKHIPGYRILDGLSMWIGATAVLQSARNSNGSSQLSGKEDATSAAYTADITFEKKFQDHGLGYLYLGAGEGAGVDEKLSLYQGVNYAAGDDPNLSVIEAWYEHYFSFIPGAVTFGKLDASSYIDTNEYANDSDLQFLGYIFNNSPVIEFPANGAAVHLNASPLEWLGADLVCQDGDSDWEDVFDGVFLAGQINFKPGFSGRQGNYRFLAWHNRTNHAQWGDPGRNRENGYGYGLSFDQELTGDIGMFFRYGWQDPDVYLVDADDPGWEFSLKRSWSLGAQFKGAVWGRPDDFIGFGFGQIMPSDRYKSANGLLAKSESQMECYYNYKLNEHLTLSPDLQVIWRPYGKDAANGDGTIVVSGLRGRLDF